MKIYVDNNHRCHTADNNGTYREMDVDFFDGKCDAFVAGYCCDDSNGYLQIFPWKSYVELEAAQLQHESDRAKLAEAYQEGVNSV